MINAPFATFTQNSTKVYGQIADILFESIVNDFAEAHVAIAHIPSLMKTAKILLDGLVFRIKMTFFDTVPQENEQFHVGRSNEHSDVKT